MKVCRRAYLGRHLRVLGRIYDLPQHTAARIYESDQKVWVEVPDYGEAGSVLRVFWPTRHEWVGDAHEISREIVW